MRGRFHHLVRQWRIHVVATLFFVAAAAAADHWGALAWLERPLYDFLVSTFRRNPTPSQDITIVAIDDRTLSGLRNDYKGAFGNWPYHRELWSRVIDYLHRVGARAIAMDFVLDERDTDVGRDKLFHDQILQSKLPLFVGFTFRPLGSDEKPPELGEVALTNRIGVQEYVAAPAITDDTFGEEGPATLTSEETARALAFPVKARGVALPRLSYATASELKDVFPVPPIPELLSILPGFGLVETEADPDGVLRRTHFAYTMGARGHELPYVTLSVAVAADLFGAKELELSPGVLRLGDRTLDIDRDGSAEIDYGGRGEERFPPVSLIALLRDAEQKEPTLRDRFQNRVVFIAGYVVGTYDVKATPFERKEQGVIKQASQLDSLLSGTFIRHSPGWSGPLLALVLGLLIASGILLTTSPWLQVAWFPAAALMHGVIAAAAIHWAIHVPLAMPLASFALCGAWAMGLNYFTADQERQRMQKMFSRYVSKLVVDGLAALPQGELPKLDGENREVTAFFSDIRKFSTFSEKFKDDPKQLVRLLNTYLTRVSGALLQHGACLDKYIGDAVVCIFGAPLPQQDHAVRACKAALSVQAEVNALRQEYAARGLPDVYTRVGVNSAVMFVGNFGSEQLFNYTAMGDGMNLASRLEGANKAYETLILIGPRTYELAKDFVEARELDHARVAGKTEAVAIYELMALKGALSPAKQQVVALHGRAVAAYREARFADALALLEQALAVDVADGPSKVLAERCRKFLEHPPPMPFDAVVNLDK